MHDCAAALVVLKPFFALRHGVSNFVALHAPHRSRTHDLGFLRGYELAHHAVADELHLVVHHFVAIRLGFVRLVSNADDGLMLVRLEVLIMEDEQAQYRDAVPKDLAPDIEHLLHELVR